MLGRNGDDETAVVRQLLRLTESDRDQVFTAHAELEGGRLGTAFESLLAGWRAQGHQVVTLGDLHRALDRGALSKKAVHWGSVPGRSGELIVA